MNTSPEINVGTDNFAKLLLQSSVFVDKSMFIKEFLEASSGEVVLIARPRRWGKSLNMDMLKCFLTIEVDEQGAPLPQEESLNRKLFVGGKVVIGPKTGKVRQLTPLKIAQQCPDLVSDYQGQCPVISLGLKDVKGSSYQRIEASVKAQIIELYTEYGYLKQYIQAEASLLEDSQKEKLQRYFKGKISQEDLADSLHFLSKLLYKHFGKPVYVLIDEYDAPINDAYLEFKNNPGEFSKVLKLFRGLFGAALKSNPYLARGLITGILRIAKANILSDLNNLREYTLFDKRFASSYGFSEQEVDELLDQVPIDTDRAAIQHWYNGYTFGEELVYNPWSIMCCLSNKGKLGSYWLDSGGTKLIDLALLSDDIQKDLQTLTSGKSIVSAIVKQVSFEVLQNPVGLFSLLLFSGYLNPAAIPEAEELYQLSIPNYEVQHIYKQRLLDWVSKRLPIDLGHYHSLARFLAMGELETFKKYLEELLAISTSFHQTGDKMSEVFYNGFMLCLLSCLSYYYLIESERESGRGRPDVMLIPKATHGDQAMVIEYKVGQDVAGLPGLAEEGLSQIRAKGYGTQAKSQAHVKKLLQVCLAFSGKEVALQYEEVTL